MLAYDGMRLWHEQKEYAPYLYSGNGADGKEPGTAGVHVRIPRNRDGRGQADQRKNDLPAYGRSDAGGKKGETDMRYRCNCPEYEERPCDNPNEKLECEECQYGEIDHQEQ